MKREITLYEEKSFDTHEISKYIRLRKKETSIFVLFLFLLIINFLIFVFDKRIDIGIQTILLVIMCIFLYEISIKSHIRLREVLKNPIVVTSKKIVIGKRVFELKDIKRSVYNISTGDLYIYFKDSKKFRTCKDVSKTHYLGAYTHFSYIEYGKALKKLGIPFEVVRKKGLFGTEPVMGKERYERMNHEERYKRWLEKQRSPANGDNKSTEDLKHKEAT